MDMDMDSTCSQLWQALPATQQTFARAAQLQSSLSDTTILFMLENKVSPVVYSGLAELVPHASLNS